MMPKTVTENEDDDRGRYTNVKSVAKQLFSKAPSSKFIKISFQVVLEVDVDKKAIVECKLWGAAKIQAVSQGDSLLSYR